MPSTSIFLMPRCAPRTRRRSTPLRRTPVMSQVRQVSLAVVGAPGLSTCHIFDDVPIVDVEALSVPGGEERAVKAIEAGLPTRSFGRGEGEPSSHDLRRGRGPDLPAVILGVHLREREVSPANLDVSPARALHGIEQYGRPVDERTEVVEEDVDLERFRYTHTKICNAAGADAYSRQLGVGAHGSRRPPVAVRGGVPDRAPAERRGVVARRGRRGPPPAGVGFGGSPAGAGFCRP